ncbi:histidine phosphatase family protein [Clostridium cochlearium]|uniref:Histidine phosphatase family protein n=2 Tax=Clostridium cochlearium TaxID=1494 RepID=A0A7Y3Y030_CLOCO|nr:histidine phosphatase family protein [Clostridium cochlearium]NME95539.1 histidine phosphatase family protein [Clostridium cochlearium]NOH17052.1 histidine phosphatase family protein [Clostridium cochlearium]NSJ91286.1 histidine phosphatase family protein [Coprococcus sp. MSK.21.13]
MEMGTILYITRHGQTIWNTQRKMQGWKDSPLTQLGLKQAKRLGKRLEDDNIDIIYSSPLGRALKTAKIIRGQRDISILCDERLKEIKLGKWEGIEHYVIDSDYKEEIYNFWNNPKLYKSVEGETFLQLRNRVKDFLDEIIKKHKNKTILIVTHAITLKAIMNYIEDLTIDNFWGEPHINPTSLTKVEIEESNVKILLNADISHLDGIE